MDGSGPQTGADPDLATAARARPPVANPATAIISMGGILVGIPVADLREVMAHPPTLNPLPAGGPYALGCVPLRGQVIPVLDLSSALNLPETDEIPNIIAVLRADDRVVGIRAQAVRRIVQSRDLVVQDVSSAGSEMSRLVLPTVALVGRDVVSLLDARALLNMPEVSHSAELKTRSNQLDRSSQFLLCQIDGWRYCVSVRQIKATLPNTAVDNSVLYQGACEGAVERHGIVMALLNPRVHTGFAPAGDRPVQSGGIVLQLDGTNCLTLRADRITDILHLQRSQMSPMPTAQCSRPDLFQGVIFGAGGEPCYVLDLDKLTAEPEVQLLAEVAHRRGQADPTHDSAGDGPKGVPGTAIFVRAGGLRALPIREVDEIVPPVASLLGAMPRYDGFVGSISHRDALLPVFCMAWLAGVSDASPGERPGIVVVRQNGERIGLLVQDIVGIERVRFVQDVPDSPGGPVARLAMRAKGTTARLVAVWDLESGQQA